MGSQWPFRARRHMHLLDLVQAGATITLDATASGVLEQNEPATGGLGSYKTNVVQNNLGLASDGLRVSRAQALLSQYVALHHEHQGKLSQLLDQLRQYGYQAEYKGPLAAEPLQLLGLTDMPQACPSSHDCRASNFGFRVYIGFIPPKQL